MREREIERKGNLFLSSLGKHKWRRTILISEKKSIIDNHNSAKYNKLQARKRHEVVSSFFDNMLSLNSEICYQAVMRDRFERIRRMKV